MHSRRFLFVIFLLAIFSACTPQTDAAPTEETTAEQINEQQSTPTESLPTETATPEIVETATTIPSKPQTVYIYLVNMGDMGASGEMIGCGDSIVPVEVAIEPTLEVLQAAYTQLLNLPANANYSETGLMNSLSLSDLQIESLNIVDKEAIVRLSGTLIYGGECDIPRIEEQLYRTALQFSTIDSVVVFVNDVPLEELLDLRG